MVAKVGWNSFTKIESYLAKIWFLCDFYIMQKLSDNKKYSKRVNSDCTFLSRYLSAKHFFLKIWKKQNI